MSLLPLQTASRPGTNLFYQSGVVPSVRDALIVATGVCPVASVSPTIKSGVLCEFDFDDFIYYAECYGAIHVDVVVHGTGSSVSVYLTANADGTYDGAGTQFTGIANIGNTQQTIVLNQLPYRTDVVNIPEVKKLYLGFTGTFPDACSVQARPIVPFYSPTGVFNYSGWSFTTGGAVACVGHVV